MSESQTCRFHSLASLLHSVCLCQDGACRKKAAMEIEKKKQPFGNTGYVALVWRKPWTSISKTDKIQRDNQQTKQCPSGDSSLSKLFLSKLFLASTGRSRLLASHSSSSTSEQILAISTSSGLGGCWKPQKADFISG